MTHSIQCPGKDAHRLVRAPFASDRLTQRPERRSHFRAKNERLFPGSEVSALLELVVMNELWKRPLCPRSRSRIDFVWEHAHRHWNRNILHIEKRQLVFPIKTSRRDCRVRQPVQCDVVEDVISRETFGFSVEHARDELITARVMI